MFYIVTTVTSLTISFIALATLLIYHITQAAKAVNRHPSLWMFDTRGTAIDILKSVDKQAYIA